MSCNFIAEQMPVSGFWFPLQYFWHTNTVQEFTVKSNDKFIKERSKICKIVTDRRQAEVCFNKPRIDQAFQNNAQIAHFFDYNSGPADSLDS